MVLTPPPDHTRTFLVAAIGASVVLLVYVYSRSTLPGVGDNLHSLPHGGFYRDGTKTIHYGAPCKLNSLESTYSFTNQPWAYILLLTLLIVICESLNRRGTCSCGRAHAR
uniref:Movement protein TGB2 n=1 Tax=Tagetes carlavirus 1 TaxID=2794422 RepID=A0A7T5UFS1_9VIRU|nr:TGB2 [Tagetes carlavirus 1]